MPDEARPIALTVADIGKETDVHLIVALMILKHIPPVRTSYWKDNNGELDYMLVSRLDNGDRDRVCGFVAKGEDGWDVITLKSGGAKTGFDARVESLDTAKSKVEQDCK